MSITAFLVLFSAGLVCLICTILVFHPDYDDNLIRRLALAMLALGAFLRVEGIVELHNGFTRAFSNVAIIVWLGLALFMVDHFYSFVRKARAARQRKRRETDSRRPNGAQSTSA